MLALPAVAGLEWKGDSGGISRWALKPDSIRPAVGAYLPELLYILDDPQLRKPYNEVGWKNRPIRSIHFSIGLGVIVNGNSDRFRDRRKGKNWLLLKSVWKILSRLSRLNVEGRTGLNSVTT